MKTYRTSFYRKNYGFNPPLEQKSDVVFSTEIPFDDEHLEQFETAAWEAMYKQNPHWQDPTGPIEGLSGWSSVMGGDSFQQI